MRGDWKYGNEAWKTAVVVAATIAAGALALLLWAAL